MGMKKKEKKANDCKDLFTQDGENSIFLFYLFGFEADTDIMVELKMITNKILLMTINVVISWKKELRLDHLESDE